MGACGRLRFREKEGRSSSGVGTNLTRSKVRKLKWGSPLSEKKHCCLACTSIILPSFRLIRNNSLMIPETPLTNIASS